MLHFHKDQLTVFQSALYQTTTAVVETEQAMIITDPNWLPEEVREIKQFVDDRLGNRMLYLIYTHSDFDHIIGAGAFPKAFVIASKAFHNNPGKRACLEEAKAFDSKHYIERDYTHVYPHVDRMITMDGDALKLGDMTLHFYLAPGHTADGLFTVIEPYGILLSGDYLSDVECPFISYNWKKYKQTAKKAGAIMEEHDIRCHVPGHGNVTEDKNEMIARLAFTQDYLDRLNRDVDALEKECRERFLFFDGMIDMHRNNIRRAAKEEHR
ncbi:hypothetical protein ADIAL_1389 [Alkalibacterium sp. AK22]|uniref:MBL fold metallo-hydrolase n=1 Tax=Alkalibacterium sp. AK22 TaxID=1229520 RepID=UPI0004464DED|nr:MBL fold metallo-hydrolase [Alkalibacterium sp. AK22]EXJ23242.1 hypothetical protein ADIAL_1389 [Alkalibacterium sp. AK22]